MSAMMVCDQVITWLQTLTVASVLLNFFLAGLAAVMTIEARKAWGPR
jgi:hypothetical protein